MDLRYSMVRISDCLVCSGTRFWLMDADNVAFFRDAQTHRAVALLRLNRYHLEPKSLQKTMGSLVIRMEYTTDRDVTASSAADC